MDKRPVDDQPEPAFLAARSVRGLLLTFPGTTGVPVPATGGRRFDPSPHAMATA